MKFATWLIALVLIVCVFSTHRGVRRSKSEAERFFSMRVAIFAWIAGFAFLIALIFLPNKQRILLMLPIFVFAMSVTRLWRTGRARLRREEEERGSLDRMKRVN